MVKIKKKAKTTQRVLKNSRCLFFYYNGKISDNLIFAESRNGRDLAGNVLRILIEIKHQFGSKYDVVVAAQNESVDKVKKILKAYNLSDAEVVKYESVQYFRRIWQAKYLINDTTFPQMYIKKEGQIYLNTWHGTPLKHMGKDSLSDRHQMDNVQRNLFLSDYLLAPSDYYKEIMISAYYLKGLYKGKILKAGYPRNSIFFNRDARRIVRERYELQDKKVYVYLPTYRDQQNINELNGWIANFKSYLSEIDNNLTEDEVLFVKLHYFVGKSISFDDFSNIKEFPEDIETYEFLNGSDCLITDYSSVFYDYANSKRKMVFFTYDSEEYAEKRGTYDQPIEFPFPNVKTVPELIEEVRKPTEYDWTLFSDTYNTFDCQDAARKIVSHIFLNADTCQEESIYDEERENVLIYGGSLAKNGITTSLNNLLNCAEAKRNYCIAWNRKIMAGQRQNFNNISGAAPMIGFSGSVFFGITEAIAYVLFNKFSINTSWIENILKKMYKREINRSFYMLNFSTYIQFNGYDRLVIGLFQNAPGRRIIYVHSNMMEEINKKGNQHKSTLRQAYRSYDKVAVVSEQLIESTYKISGKKNNIYVAQNFFDYTGIVERSKKNIEYQTNTIAVSYNTKGIEGFLNEHEPIMINIGRFSAEKGHAKLIKAFDKFHQRYPASGLIIIGGYGKQFQKTIQLAASGNASSDITIIYSIDNPMPVLKKCHLFVLSSDYEGLGLVLLEAAALDIPAISTRVTGPEKLMEDYGGYLVDNSEEGLIKGMNDYMNGQVQVMNINWKRYNEICTQEFENLFK